MKVFDIKDTNKIPEKSYNAMKSYFYFLKKKLVFPIEGTFEKETGPLSSKTIPIKLYDLSDTYDDFYGVLVEGKTPERQVVIPLVEFTSNDENCNFQIIDDYKTWFCNW